MNKFILFLFILICASKILLANDYKNSVMNYKNFGNIPILHDGRIKPLSSFAKMSLFNLSKTHKIDNLTSIEWLAELFFDPTKSYDRKIFFVNNKNLLMNLDLNYETNSLYSLNQLIDVFQKRFNLIKSLQKINTKNLTISQSLMLDLYHKMLFVLALNEIMDFIIPNLENNKEPFLNLDLTESKISKYKFLKNIKLKFNDNELKLKKLEIDLIKKFNLNKQNYIYLIPSSDIEWFTLESGFLKNSIYIEKYLNLLENIALAYLNKDVYSWNSSWKTFELMSYNSLSNKHKMKLEIIYDKISLFNLSIFLYLITFFLSIFVFFNKFENKSVIKLMWFFLIVGFLINLSGVILRILITSRPPITSLYESIIFVNLILVFVILILANKFKLYFNILFFIGSISAIFLQYIGYRLNIDSDSFKNLMSVLNTDFWLIVHVITISLGYAFCLIAGILGHIYLYVYVKHIKNINLLAKFNNILLILCLIALFFSLSGTILGGVWADQSWGRFWGWDPKENGALLIVLWLILMLHTRMINIFSPILFAIGMILNNVIVFITWFGVNLLNIGLHTYGFIHNMEKNLLLFCSFEILYICIFISVFYFKNKSFK